MWNMCLLRNSFLFSFVVFSLFRCNVLHYCNVLPSFMVSKDEYIKVLSSFLPNESTTFTLNFIVC